MNSQTTGKKKLFGMLSYASGDTLGGGVGQVISAYYLTFLLYVVGLNPILAGLVTGIGKLWDGITDPVMGVIVDRTKTKWGACRPYFLISIIPLFFTYFMLWYGWGIQGEAAKFVYFAFAYMAFSTAFTIAIVPYEALLPKIIDSYQERTNYSSLRMIFSGVGCVLSTYIYEWLVPSSSLSPLNIENFRNLGLVLGLLFSLPMLFTFLGTKEKKCLVSSQKINLKMVFLQYKEVLQSKTYRKYFTLNLCGAFVSSAVLSSLMVFLYITYGNIQNLLLTFSLSFIVINLKGAVEIAFFPINVFLMKKYNKHRPYLIDIPLIIIASIIVLFVTAQTPVWWFLIAMAFLGAGTSCLLFVPMTLLPDLADVDQIIHGKRREGSNAGLTTMGKKIVSGLALTIFGFILGIFGLNTNEGTQSPSTTNTNAIWAVKLMFCVIPLIVCAIMLIVSRSYKLDERRHTLIKSLLKRKEDGEEITFTDEEITACEEVTGHSFDTLWISKD